MSMVTKARFPYSNSNTVNELKAFCKEEGLPVSGKKQVLLDRLQQKWDDHASIRAHMANAAASSTAPSVAQAPVNTKKRAREETIAPLAPYVPRAFVQPSSIDALFAKYQDEDTPGIIGEEGLGKLSEDMGMDATTNIGIVVLCWKLGAKTHGQITKEEFKTGMLQLKLDSVEGLKSYKPYLDPARFNEADFRSVYRYVFAFSRTGTVKSVEKDICISLLPMIMGNRSKRTAEFIEFLEQHQSLLVISADEWNSFFEFTLLFKGPEIVNYNDEASWPVLIDDFVTYVQEKRKATKAK